MTTAWLDDDWSKGILLGIKPDPTSGYRATVWFEYTRRIFNEIREGSLIAIRNFSDRRRNPNGSPAEDRNAGYEEYSILQIDQVYPWHYAIQGGGEQGYPGFTVASAESARRDWLDMDIQNRDDVSRVKCEAIPIRLAFRLDAQDDQLPEPFFDRSMPMPGFEARLLSSEMVRAVLNRDIDEAQAFELGRHVVQYDVPIMVERHKLARLHFGIFGYTGSGKSNLVSSLVDRLLASGRQPAGRGEQAFKVVLIDLMDEYTGLLIDHLISHDYSRLIVCGRRTLPERVLTACEEVGRGSENAAQLALEAAEDWSRRLILPSELKEHSGRYVERLMSLILRQKIVFYEPRRLQGQDFTLGVDNLRNNIGTAAFGRGSEDRERLNSLLDEIDNLLGTARDADGDERRQILNQIISRLNDVDQDLTTGTGRKAVKSFIREIEEQMRSREPLPGSVTTEPYNIVNLLNFQPSHPGASYLPSLNVVIGEDEGHIITFVSQLIENCFENRRTRSILYPTVSFIFDEADVFIAQDNRQSAGNLVAQATMLARRGRKFGLGIGIATQRVVYLDTSIMAQPHTYFVSKLPRKSDRERIADAFAISDETLKQTFGFTVGQWLVTSHDATGLKGVPFPVQLPNANDRIRRWLGVERDQNTT